MSGPHVLVVRLDNAGDVLLSGPAVRAVAATATRVTYLAGPGGRAAAELLPGVDDVITFDAPWVALDAAPFDRGAIDAVVDDLAVRGIDQAAVLTSFHQSPLPVAFLLRMAGIPTIAATSVDHPGSLVDVRRRPGALGQDEEDVHEVLRSLALVEDLGHRLPAGDDARLAVRRPLPEIDRPDGRYVVVHPGASVPARGLGAERAGAVVHGLAARGWQVVVTGGPAERSLTAQVAGDHRGAWDVGGATDLAGLAALLDGAAAVVTGNTGPAHLAAAVGTPVVCVFAAVVPAGRWHPWGVRVELLGDQDVACAGCRARACPFDDQPCVAALTPDVVLSAVERLVGRADGPDGPDGRLARGATA